MTLRGPGAYESFRKPPLTPREARLPSAGDGEKLKPMTDLTREEMTARLEAVEARSDAKFATVTSEMRTGFAELRAEIKEISARSIGKTSFFFGLIALFAAIVGVMSLMPAWFGSGLAASSIADAAAAKAVAAYHAPAKP